MAVKGIDGVAKTLNIMSKYRNNPSIMIGKWEVIAVRDYRIQQRKEMSTGKNSNTGLPLSDVLYYELSDDAWYCVRPSGTESKIRFYMGVKGKDLEDAKKQLQMLKEEVLKIME